ncbi:phage head closure protein [Bacillus sp. OTU530]|uniref:phage head closure protein n=1 Tax=Bacillus sp. OTU530 TaxID=3043862 RepID=UPI00313B718A
MNPGKLNKRIVLQKLATVDDGAGGSEESWQDTSSVWALIQPLQGRELYQAQQINTELTHRITIRYREDVNASMRIMYNNREFTIDSIVNIEESNRFLEMTCREKVK